MAKKTTVKDIAARLGISSSTVSFVLNNKDQGISADTCRKVIDAAILMDYRKVPKASMLGWLRIAYLTPRIQYFNFHTSFFAEVYNHLQRKAFEAKIELSLLEFDNMASIEKRYLQLQKFQNMDIDIYICNNAAVAEYLVGNGLKVILSQGGRSSRCVNVFCDDYTAGRLAAEYAFDMGHRVAGMIFPKNASSPRLEGFMSTFSSKGGTCPKEFQWFPDFEHGKIENHIKKRAHAKNLPTLFYCFADNIMFPAIRGFSASGLKIPDDVSLIGTDNLYWGKFNQPAFTTIDLCEELFAEKLIEAIKHVNAGKTPYQLAVPVCLLKRETVKDIS